MKNTIRDLYLEQLLDIHSAESQLLEALPRLAIKATDKDLKKAFSEHLEESKGQLDRIVETIGRHTSIQAGSHTCEAMKGLLREGEEALQDIGDSIVVDIHLIAAASRVEHYEIAAYQSALSMAEALNEKDDADNLKKSLKQEEDAAGNLNKLADGGIFSKGLTDQAVE